MKILLFTYREIKWILSAYDVLHKKYWGEPYTLIAEEDYLGSGDFIKPPFAGDSIHGGSYHEVMRWTLNEIQDEFVLIMCADYLLYTPVKKYVIEQIIEYMTENPTVLRAQIGNNSGIIQRATKTDEYKDITILEHNFLPTSLTPGLWNKKLLVDLMSKMSGSHTAWDMELRGRDIYPNTGYRSLGVTPEPMQYINALRGRNNNSIVITQDVYNEVKEFIPDNVVLPDGITR